MGGGGVAIEWEGGGASQLLSLQNKVSVEGGGGTFSNADRERTTGSLQVVSHCQTTAQALWV